MRLLTEDANWSINGFARWSRGKIYALALKTGARKTENRIRERHDERRKRQQDFLQSIVNSTTKADVLDFMDGLPDDSVAMHLTSNPL